MAARRGPLLALVLLLAGATGGAAAADVTAYGFTRTLDVPAAAPVRVPLDLAALRHLGPAPPAVFAPDGREVPATLAPDLPSQRPRAVTAVEAKQQGESWVILLDVGAAPPLHEQLQFRIEKVTAAPAVRLEGSDDRRAWQPLAAGDLFRLGSDARLERTALTYAPSRYRFLRLTWPAAAGTPELRGVEVLEAAGRSLLLRSERPACRSGGAMAACALPLPAPRQVVRRLTMRLAADGAGGSATSRVGYRLLTPGEARWRELAAGTAVIDSAEVELAIPLPAERLSGEPLRLELYGSGASPRLAGYALEVAQPLLAFDAPTSGRYTLAYGGGEGAGGTGELGMGSGAAERGLTGGLTGGPTWAVLGPERTQELPPLPAGVTGPGQALDAIDFTSEWPIRAARAEAGEVVRLELPGAVLAAAGPERNGLRLAVATRQLPYVRLTLDAPALVASRRGLQPQPAARDGESGLAVTVPAPAPPLSSLTLAALPAFRRGLTVAARRPGPPGGGDEQILDYGSWDCRTRAPLPCRREVPLGGVAPERLVMRFDDGDNPSLPAVDVALWRPREMLVFVWPAAEEVRLLAGPADLAAPRYDLELLAPQLLARPWRPAQVDLGGGGPAKREPPWQPWLLPAALAIAGVGLLLLLGRLLATRS